MSEGGAPGQDRSIERLTSDRVLAFGELGPQVREWGFAQELLNDSGDASQEMEAEFYEAMAAMYPSIYELYLTVAHDDSTTVGPGCDDQFEFEFALDLMLDGLEKLKG